jgi:hypothetical protein
VAADAQPPGAAVGRGPARGLWPLLAGAALCLALVGLDAGLGERRNFSSTVVIAPFLTALLGTTRQTAAVGALAVACCLASPVWNANFGSVDYLVRACSSCWPAWPR